MKRMISLSFLILLIPALVYAQDRVGTPVWNVEDKWNITGEVTIVVVNADESFYSVKYLTAGGESILVYEKSTLNRLYSMERDRRVKYEGRNKRLFNFPFEIGKEWKDKFIVKPTSLGGREMTYVETFTPLGWEDIQIQAGKFKAVKFEYKQEVVEQTAGQPKEGRVWYWYSPEVKYMIKCQYEKSDYWDALYNWEGTSFKLKK